ncbi:SDR family oxidoreductase [Kamptonema sp. UHCC 0994]|uniref:SDR family oxidoreductase n=1 Tax=Kamptonema sp. UHCC 0994 TaxID=3031329 RepID=UPI0023B8E044|nr:SDR family oxidoreductase [Kamptonema sp. UHCC 0994]MDF0555430.1 SDR family oxidoreductase [Kamptonema sp. UHCC 0994]
MIVTSIISDRGSFTLTTGVLAREPIPGSAALSLVNGGLEGFVRAAALEMPRSIRINVISPPWVSETLEAMGQDGANGMPAAKVALAYVDSLEGERSGEIIDPRSLYLLNISITLSLTPEINLLNIPKSAKIKAKPAL